MYLGGLTNFSRSQKNRGARRQSCQQLKRMTPNIDDKVTNERARNFLTTVVKCREMSSIPSFRTWATLPIRLVVSAEQRKTESHCYTVQPHGKCRGWTQFHRSNFLSVIDACIFTLNLFHFRSDTNWFCSQFFQAKIKIGLLCDPAPTNRIQLSYLSKQEQTLQEHSQDLSIC